MTFKCVLNNIKNNRVSNIILYICSAFISNIKNFSIIKLRFFPMLHENRTGMGGCQPITTALKFFVRRRSFYFNELITKNRYG